MRSLPYFRWYPKDAETDENFKRMTDQEAGFYLRCLNHCWINGSLPADFAEMGETLNRPTEYCERLWPRLSKCFRLKEGRLINPRQEIERASAKEQAAKNKKAAELRWSTESDTYDADAMHGGEAHALQQGDAVQRAYESEYISESEVSSKKETTTPEVSLGQRQEVWFSEFWGFYWRRISRASALSSYRRKVPSEEIAALVLCAVKEQSPGMMAREPHLRPHASTWLNQERWNDEIEAPAQNGHRPRGLTAEEIAAL